MRTLWIAGWCLWVWTLEMFPFECGSPVHYFTGLEGNRRYKQTNENLAWRFVTAEVVHTIMKECIFSNTKNG